MIEEEKLDWENEFKDKFHESWHEKMKIAVESQWMFDIYQRLKADFLSGVKILPRSADTFNAFKYTNAGTVKVIFYLLDPYPRVYPNKIPQATGIAMSCDNSPDGKLQPSLEKFYDAIERELKSEIDRNISLKYLLEQGVMMLNTDLTCKRNKTGSHEGLWEPFQKYFLEEIMGSTGDIIYVLCGKGSKKMKKYIYPTANHIIEVEHPAAAAYNNSDWNSEGIFIKINNILKSIGKTQVYWDRAKWEEELNDLPF